MACKLMRVLVRSSWYALAREDARRPPSLPQRFESLDVVGFLRSRRRQRSLLVSRPFGTWLIVVGCVSALKRRAIFGCPFGTGLECVVSFNSKSTAGSDRGEGRVLCVRVQRVLGSGEGGQRSNRLVTS
jgi:hypothetical protein